MEFDGQLLDYWCIDDGERNVGVTFPHKIRRISFTLYQFHLRNNFRMNAIFDKYLKKVYSELIKELQDNENESRIMV